MLSRITHYASRFWRAEFCSPKDFVRRAVFISVAFLILHLVGLRDFTTVLSGTAGSVELGWGMSAFFGLLYVCGWLGLVVLAPILLLAAALLAIWNRITENHRSSRRLPSRSLTRAGEEARISVVN